MMKLNQISSVSFSGGCDVHMHSGHWWCNAQQGTLNAVKIADNQYAVLKDLSCDVFQIANGALTNPDNTIDKVIISNLDCMVRTSPACNKDIPFLKNEIDGNLELLLKSKNPNEYLYATGQPGTGNAENLKRIIEKAPEKFIGIKLHPKQIDIPCDNPLYEPYIKLAKEKKLPVLFHSQVAANWVPDPKNSSKYIPQIIEDVSKWDPSDPRRIYALAKKYPNVPVILGHSGGGAGDPGHKIALDVILESVKNKNAKLYCDISWMDFNHDLPSDNPKNIIAFIKKMKKANTLDRILFGSDVPVGMFGEKQAGGISDLSPAQIYDDMQSKIKGAIRNDVELKNEADEIIDMIFYKNADELFFKKEWAKDLKDNLNPAAEGSKAVEAVKKMSKTKMVLIALGAGITFLGVGALIISKLGKSKSNINSQTKSVKTSLANKTLHEDNRPNMNSFLQKIKN